MLKPEIKEKWVAALRSGEYKQGRGFLHKADTFCCLGVLCDLHAKETGLTWEPYISEAEGILGDYMCYMGAAGVPSETVREWSGQTTYGLVVGMNDRGESFAKIATYIEENL